MYDAFVAHKSVTQSLNPTLSPPSFVTDVTGMCTSSSDVVYAPTMPFWSREAVEILFERFGLPITVEPSHLDQPPPSP